MHARLLLLATTLTACTRPDASFIKNPSPATPPPPTLAELEARRDAATPELVERTRNGPDARLAIRALGRVGDPAAISRLLELLTVDATRADAARALGTAKLLGAELDAAEPALLSLWPASPLHDRPALAEALGRLGTAASLPVLATALREGSPELRESAAIALGVLGRRATELTPEARDALLAAAADPSLHYAVAYAIAHEHLTTLDPGATATTARESRDAATAAREPGDQLLTTLASAPSPETRALALTGLTRRKAHATRTRALFHAALADRDFRVRVAAVRGLLALADPAATRHLLTWATTTSADPRSTHALQELLANLRPLLPRDESDDAAADQQLWTALRRLARDPDMRVACRARALLPRSPALPLDCPGLAPHIPAVLALEAVAHDRTATADERRAALERPRVDPDPRVRAAAVTAAAALARRGEPTPEPWQLAALADPSPAVVGSLADAFAADRPQISPAVRDALAARTRDELHREIELYAALVAALAATGGPAEPCTAGLDHPNPAVRTAARACLKTLTGTDPGPRLPARPPQAPPHPPLPTTARLHWRLTTDRGAIDIDLDPVAAPWHVAALVANTRAGFYDGLTFHRVVPGFVVQGGDPEGTGWGGPGYTIPSEPGAARFTRGGVGIADAGKDTGGCQFFFMHARAPHLEGRFTRVGEVTRGQEIVDALVVGDTIRRAEILP